ncbi:MAG: 23S ribosomal RNA methyltransferase Erm [Dehalococcoidia bacterium]
MAHRHHNQHHPESSIVTARRPELSQHFLRDPRLARALVGGMRLPRGSLVLEVGPGRGTITEALADAGFRVIAVEKDVRLYRSLRARFIGRTNIECHHADFLSFRAPARPHAVVSSVPYGITTAVVRRVLGSAATDAFLIVQREAAQKFAGVPTETLFSLLHKPWHEITIERAFRRTDFVPQPSVESALLRVRRRERPLVARGEAADYRAFVGSGFGAPSMREALGERFTWRQIARLSRDLRFSRDARPPQLTFPQWLALFRFLEHVCHERRLAWRSDTGMWKVEGRGAGRCGRRVSRAAARG